jgi:hypothetical protein
LATSAADITFDKQTCELSHVILADTESTSGAEPGIE